MRTVRRPSRGITLVEAVATMVILATVSGVVSGIVWAGVRAFDEGAESARLHNEASMAMERMVRDLRAVPLDDTDTPDITSLTAESITWDGSTRTLALDGSDLVLTVAGESGVLLRDVSGFSINAYDGSNNAMASTLTGIQTDEIRRLSLEVTASRGRASATIRTKIFLRCMMLEVGE
ncbi:MAG: prepilin-type N-terminal cleavage/methylation domain-containing protein [Phycisphaerales bacterium]|nr:prepilin-type N-terminal cleavage/methylation domain-containing protein [Phycisphaerales bacterium]